MKKITLILITLLMLTCFSSAATLKKTIGTVSVSTTIPEGRQITLRYAQDVTNFVKWIVRTENVTLTDETATTITFTMPATDVEIIADDGQLLELSVSIDGELLETTQRYAGESITVTAVEKEGMAFKQWDISGLTGVDTTANPLTFTMPNNNVEIIATFGASVVIANTAVPIGAYIEYVPTATSAKAYDADTGYTTTAGYQEFNPSSTTSWRVMYNNNGQLDIISADAVDAISGDGLYLCGETGYAKAVDTLNNLCSVYANPDIATGGRSIGCTSDSIGTINEANVVHGVSRSPYTDDEYLTDLDNISNLLHTTTSVPVPVYLASRVADAGSSRTHFYVRRLYSDGTYNMAEIWNENASGNYSDDYTSKLCMLIRPVVSLASTIKITDGEGTVEKPYKIATASGCTHNFSRVCNVNGATDTIQCANCTYTETKTCKHNYYVTENIDDSKGTGTVTFDKTTVKAGGSITVTVTPDSGSGIDNIIISDEAIEVPNDTGMEYTINNITENKEVSVTFCPGP